MTPNEVIYHIKQDRRLSDMWAHFSRAEKADIIRRMQAQTPNDLEKVLLEVKTGQNRLF